MRRCCSECCFLVGQCSRGASSLRRTCFCDGPEQRILLCVHRAARVHVLGGLGGLGLVERRLAAGVLGRDDVQAAAASIGTSWPFSGSISLALLTIRG